MQLRQLTDILSVSAQIDEADVDVLAGQGFRSVINNRPDGEVPGQPDSTVLAAAAARHGMAYMHLPVVTGQWHQDVVDAFGHSLHTLPTPILAFCRSGTRSCTLWALSAFAAGEDREAVIACAATAGYDLSALAIGSATGH
ncbi:TIGR01244 family sulfur transferase [Rhodanobacter sp. MP7CTX1]|uniref:TIGR01244 family sulfur transferase n=1 Tax=Rhodanobacter sp. MP7CTX1 TaxID=2723084 RepID=UPI0016124396|nr:TIGR01244 family sulfur transferase [Rhodanobacter sp. MP7CTX1]MBB6188074.1 sulfide:quinone oxidoreductase [Rhodanobacter sp. MP7CTX1]